MDPELCIGEPPGNIQSLGEGPHDLGPRLDGSDIAEKSLRNCFQNMKILLKEERLQLLDILSMPVERAISRVTLVNNR